MPSSTPNTTSPALLSIPVCLGVLSLSSRSEELLWPRSWVGILYNILLALEMRAVLFCAGHIGLPNFLGSFLCSGE